MHPAFGERFRDQCLFRIVSVDLLVKMLVQTSIHGPVRFLTVLYNRLRADLMSKAEHPLVAN